MLDVTKYRPGVGLMLFNKLGKVFVGDRIDEFEESWQMPQGGIDDNEDIRKALFREVSEEIGTMNIEIVMETKTWLYYDLPGDRASDMWDGKYIGQRQKWFLCRFLGQDSEININAHHIPEFSSWKWVDRSELVGLAVDFKKKLYIDVLSEFNQYF